MALCFASDLKLLQLAGYDGPPVVQSTIYEEPLLASRAAVVNLWSTVSYKPLPILILPFIATIFLAIQNLCAIYQELQAFV